MPRETVKICVVGAGASGLVAAAKSAKRLGGRGGVLIVERKDTLGKKLLASGNGRCNLTNVRATAECYYGGEPSFTQFAMESYGPRRVMDYFNELGLFLRIEEEGRVYPYTEQASSVTCLLKRELMRQRVGILKNLEIRRIRRENGLFILDNGKNKVIHAEKVILAVGGCAQPALGSDGSGFELLRGLGHRITPLFPALVQIKTDGPVELLKGIRFQGAVSLLEDEKILESRAGNLLFTSYGVSGIPVMELSRLVSKGPQILRIDFFPEYNPEQLLQLLIDRKDRLGHLTVDEFLLGLVSGPIGQTLSRAAGVADFLSPVEQTKEDFVQRITALLKAFDLNVKGTNGFENAQVTGGGAATNEFEPRTMESRLVKGLYCTGELLDVYGDCGGYNLQWAWASGLLAAAGATESYFASDGLRECIL